MGRPGTHRCTIRRQATMCAKRSALTRGRGRVFTGLESPTHLIIVLVVVLLLFGAKRIPELARGLGAAVREFKKGRRAKGRRN